MVYKINGKVFITVVFFFVNSKRNGKKLYAEISVCEAGGSGSEEINKCPPPSPAVL